VLVLRFVDERLELVVVEDQLGAFLHLRGEPFSTADTEQDGGLPGRPKGSKEGVDGAEGGRLAGVCRLTDHHGVEPGLRTQFGVERELLRDEGAEVGEEGEVEERHRRLKVLGVERRKGPTHADHALAGSLQHAGDRWGRSERGGWWGGGTTAT